MMDHQEKALVIGLGNTLRGDDALGRIASERLRLAVDSERVKVIDQCAPTPELAAEIAAASLVLFLDASADGPTDRIVTRRLSASDALEAMAHRLDPCRLIGLARHLYGRVPEAFAITFRGRSFEFNDHRLSREAEAACDSIVQATLQLIGVRDLAPAGHCPQDGIETLAFRRRL